MEYRVEIKQTHKSNSKTKFDIEEAHIMGLPGTSYTGEDLEEINVPDTWLMLSSYDGTYYANNEEFAFLDSALHAVLYDQYQTNELLKDGDILVCEYLGETYRFKCQGIHVVTVPEEPVIGYTHIRATFWEDISKAAVLDIMEVPSVAIDLPRPFKSQYRWAVSWLRRRLKKVQTVYPKTVLTMEEF